MAGIEVSLGEVIRDSVRAGVDGIHKATPATVTAYDPLTNTVVVQPNVKRALFSASGKRVFEQLPEIPYVPVIFPRVGDMAVTFPVEVGARVLLVFCDVSLAEWHGGDDVVEPVDARRHSLGWPVAIPGLYPDAEQLSSDPLDLAARAAGMVIGEHDGAGRIEITPTTIKLGKDAVDFVALATPTQAGLDACMAQANAAMASAGAAHTVANSLVTFCGALLVGLLNHVHPIPTGVTGNPGFPVGPLPPVPPPGTPGAAASAPGAVTATRAKAK